MHLLVVSSLFFTFSNITCRPILKDNLGKALVVFCFYVYDTCVF